MTLSAGGQLATGNSQILAATANGKFDMRRGDNGFGASILGNYGQGATSPGAEQHVTCREPPVTIRYNRFFGDHLSLFIMDTERHVHFQGLASEPTSTPA